MNSSKNLLFLQSFLIFLQIVNSQIAVITTNKGVAVIIGAAVGGLQFYFQMVGNNTVPPPKPQPKPPE